VLDGVSKRYGEHWVVRDVSLAIEEGELVVLLGPSGCGKTTTLRMIGGFVEPTAGRVRLGARDITALPPYRRNTGLVFQGYALFPHLTAAQNVSFGLEMRGLAMGAIRDKVGEALRLVRLAGLGDRLPRELSGGQQQRVALARALVIQPELLLLDEPLSNLDAKLREEVRVEIRQLQRTLGLTTLMVTHDQEEALTMADRLVVMSHGVIQQIGTQGELYDRPVNRFVAGFVGRTNFLGGRLAAPGRFETDGGLALRVTDGAPAGPTGSWPCGRSGSPSPRAPGSAPRTRWPARSSWSPTSAPSSSITCASPRATCCACTRRTLEPPAPARSASVTRCTWPGLRRPGSCSPTKNDVAPSPNTPRP
jgi:putative spermidine/putrescine transport system ATP-binding protein